MSTAQRVSPNKVSEIFAPDHVNCPSLLWCDCWWFSCWKSDNGGIGPISPRLSLSSVHTRYIPCFLLSSASTWFPRLLRTSVPSALERRASASRVQLSTGSFPTSCARWRCLQTWLVPSTFVGREVTSLLAMEQVESPSMEASSKMRTSASSTLDLVIQKIEFPQG